MPRSNTALVLRQANAIARARAGGRKKRRYHRGKMTIPLAVVAGFVPLGVRAYNGFKAGGIHDAGWYITNDLTGYDINARTWSPGSMLKGWAPIIAGIVAHKVANRIGINAMLARQRIPFIRI